jgi:hypothetical protein
MTSEPPAIRKGQRKPCVNATRNEIEQRIVAV